MINRRMLLGTIAGTSFVGSAAGIIPAAAAHWEDVGNSEQLVKGVPFRVVSPRRSWSLKKLPVGAYRFETRPGDLAPGDSPGKTRVELVANTSSITYGRGYWVSFSFRMLAIPNIVSSNQLGGWLLHWQLHNGVPNDGSISPSPIIGMYFGDPDTTTPTAPRGVAFYTRSSTERPLTHNPNPIQRALNPDFKQGAWTHVVMFFVLDSTGVDGKLSIWMNGKNYCALIGIPLGYVSDVGPYAQFGIYYGPQENQYNIVEFANMEPPQTASLRSRISRPLPLPSFASQPLRLSV